MRPSTLCRAASPNGALTEPFAADLYITFREGLPRLHIAPGQLPADPHYHDTASRRRQLDVPVTRVDELSIGAKFSVEDDFSPPP